MRESAAQLSVALPLAEVVPAAPAPTTAVRPHESALPVAEIVLGADGLSLPPQERLLSALVGRPVIGFEPVRSVQIASQELRGIELIAFEQQGADPQQVRYSITVRGESAAIEDLQRSLRSTAFSNQLDRLRSDVQDELQLDKSVTITVAGMSLGLSLVYVLWLIRGGVLMGSYLSALPAWRVLDPLPVLSRVDDEADEDDEALDAVAQRSGNPLRSFG